MNEQLQRMMRHDTCWFHDARIASVADRAIARAYRALSNRQIPIEIERPYLRRSSVSATVLTIL
jgi:hypothetical protein